MRILGGEWSRQGRPSCWFDREGTTFGSGRTRGNYTLLLYVLAYTEVFVLGVVCGALEAGKGGQQTYAHQHGGTPHVPSTPLRRVRLQGV